MEATGKRKQSHCVHTTEDGTRCGKTIQHWTDKLCRRHFNVRNGIINRTPQHHNTHARNDAPTSDNGLLQSHSSRHHPIQEDEEEEEEKVEEEEGGGWRGGEERDSESIHDWSDRMPQGLDDGNDDDDDDDKYCYHPSFFRSKQCQTSASRSRTSTTHEHNNNDDRHCHGCANYSHPSSHGHSTHASLNSQW